MNSKSAQSWAYGKGSFFLFALVLLLAAWGASRLAPGLTARYLGRLLQEKGYFGVHFKVAVVSPFYLHLAGIELRKGRLQASANNVHIRFSPFKLARGEMDTVFLEGAMVRLDMRTYESAEESEFSPQLSPEFSIPFNKLLIPDGDIVFVRPGFRRSLSFSGIVVKGTAGQAEATLSVGREGRSISLAGNLQEETLAGEFHYSFEWENFNEWLEMLHPYIGQFFPEDSALNIFTFSGEGKGEIESGKLSSIALVGSTGSGDWIIPAGFLVNESLHLGLRKDWAHDQFEVALSGRAESLDWHGISLEPFDYVFHRGEDEFLRGEISEVRFTHGDQTGGLTEALFEFDLGATDGSEELSNISLTFRETKFLGKQLEPFNVEAESTLDHLSYTIPALKFSEPSKQEVVLEDIHGELKFNSLESPADTNRQTLKINGLDLGDLRIEGIEIDYSIDDSGKILVTHLVGDIFGGKVACQPFKYEPSSPDLELSFQFTMLALERVGRAIPGFQGDEQGFLKGNLLLHIGENEATMYEGNFELEGNQAARVRYSQKGELTKGLEPDSAEFLEMKQLEESLADLSLEEFSVRFSNRQKDPYPMVLHLSGKPNFVEDQDSVDFTLKRREPMEIIQKWSQQIGSLFLPDRENSSL